MKTLFLILVLCFPLFGIASPYQLKGAFYLNSGDKTPVNFTIRWVEKNGQVTGFYSDDKFVNRASVNGMTSDAGRMFEIVLPIENGGIKTLSFLSASVGTESSGTSIPLQIVTRDVTGNPLTTAKFNAQFVQVISPDTAQAQEEAPCTEGFGVLAGFCGRYGGMISELSDNEKRCDLMATKDLRLEMDNEANVLFNGQNVGRLPSSVASRNIDVMSRHCRPLAGTTFPGDDCKRVNLIGTFTSQGGIQHFTGTYTIIDEKDQKSCQYSMTLDRTERI